MSSFNKIEKVAYTKKQSDIVSLSEYILFEDDAAQKKYAVLKLHNNMNQDLKSARIEISQYDENSRLIASTVVVYDTVAPANEDFVPKNKLEVLMECVKLDYELKYAKFEHCILDEGKYIPIQFTLDQFKEISAGDNIVVPTEATKPVVEKKAYSKKKTKKPLKIRDITKFNRPKSVKVFGILSTILIILAIVGASLYYRFTNFEYFDGTFQYRIINKEEVEITGLETDDYNIVIPEYIDKKPVTSVGKNAFADSKIKNVVIKSNTIKLDDYAFKNSKELTSFTTSDTSEKLMLGSGVFEGCSSLETFGSTTCEAIYENCFDGCDRLLTLSVPNATLNRNSLKGCLNLHDLYYDTTTPTLLFCELFGTSNEDIPTGLVFVSNNMTLIPVEYFGEIKTLKTVEFRNSNVKIETGALKKLGLTDSFANDFIEIYGGVITILPTATEVKITSDIPSKYVNDVIKEFAKILPDAKEAYIDNSGATIEANAFDGFSKLETITISGPTSFSSGALKENENLKTLIVENASSFDFLNPLANSNIENLIIQKTTSGIYQSTFYTFNKLKSLELPSDAYIEYQAFYYLTELESITMPLTSMSLEYLGLTKDIKTINFNGYTSTSIWNNICVGYNNLEELVLPEGVTEFNTTIVSECASLKKLVIPSSVTYMTSWCAIGSGCDELAYIETPFIGASADSTTSYSNWNNSYSATKFLKITTAITGYSYTSNGMNNIVGLSIYGFKDSTYDNPLNYCKNLKYLELNDCSINNNIKVSGLSYVFLNNVSGGALDNVNIKAKNIIVDDATDLEILDTVKLKSAGVNIKFTNENRLPGYIYSSGNYNYSIENAMEYYL